MGEKDERPGGEEEDAGLCGRQQAVQANWSRLDLKRTRRESLGYSAGNVKASSICDLRNLII